MTTVVASSMNSKKRSPAPNRRNEERNRDIDRQARAALLFLAGVRASAPPPDADRALVSDLLTKFQECSPPLSPTDVVGLIVLRLVSEFLPEGPLRPVEAVLAMLRGLALAKALEPQRMRQAGFAVPVILNPSSSDSILMGYAHEAVRRWKSWFREALNFYEKPTTERHVIARGIARLHCLRPANGEQAAARQAKRLLDAHFRRRGLGAGANLDPDDIISELYTIPQGRLGQTQILRLREDGNLSFDGRRMRDVMRKSKFALQRPGTDAAEADSPAPDLASTVDAADSLAALVGQSDSIDQVILANWDSPDVEIAKDVRISPQAVGKRRRGIRERAKRLRHEPSE